MRGYGVKKDYTKKKDKVVIVAILMVLVFIVASLAMQLKEEKTSLEPGITESEQFANIAPSTFSL
ncbi:hypothetical protein [Anaerosporobacter sp.]